jgi:hypothetical protein
VKYRESEFMCGNPDERRLGGQVGRRPGCGRPDDEYSLSLSLILLLTRVAPRCVNTLRILHAAYDATKLTFSLSLSLHG